MFAVPGDLDTPTGGYAYDKRIIEELRTRGFEVAVLNLGSDFPRPDAKARRAANDMLAKLDPAIPVVIDGLALGVLPEAAADMGKTHKLIALCASPACVRVRTFVKRCEGNFMRARTRHCGMRGM
jgi:hypothetical protein